MANITLSNFSFHGKELQDLGQIDIGYSVKQAVEPYVTFMTGISCQTQMGNYYPTGDVGRAMTGCDDITNWDNTPVQFDLYPKWWQFKNKICAVGMEANMMHGALDDGMPTSDVTGTLVARTIAQWIINDLNFAFWRYIFFNDTNESVFGGGGGLKHISAGYDASLVTWCDGFWSSNKMTRTGKRSVTITENDATTKAGQLALSPENAYKYFHDLILPYDPSSVAHIISAQPDVQCLCTVTVYNALMTYFHSKTAEKGYLYMESGDGGKNYLTFNGIKIQPMPMWDYWINRAYYDENTTTPANSVWYKPHRILFTPKSNIIVAVNNKTVYENLDVDYSATDKNIRWLTDGLFDMGIRQPDFCLVAH